MLTRIRRALYWRLWHFLTRIPVWRKREKKHAELVFWTEHWDAKLRRGEFWYPDVPTLLRLAGEWEQFALNGKPDYETMRLMEARAQVLRILNETQIDDREFFVGKTVVEIGPGAVGFLEQCGAKLGIAIEPLAREFQQHGLLLPGCTTVYLPVSAESIPLLDNFADIVVSRNSLDHVKDPFRVVSEVERILVPGGCLLLIVDVDHEATITEPHKFTRQSLRYLLSRFETIRELEYEKTEMTEARRFVGVYRKCRTYCQ